MKIGGNSHLTYCTNIHPGESWAEMKTALAAYLPQIKQRVSPEAPLGVGLRLSAEAALSLEQPEKLREFKSFLLSEGLYVFTLNGFPYGSFHRTRVKDQVYLPNWSEEPRLIYTNRLANILAALLPDDAPGSISTVPGAYLAHLNGGNDREKIADALILHVAHLHALHEKTGKQISLALEPEPGCLLETSADVVSFFGDYLHSPAAARRLCELTGLAPDAALQALRQHLGLCLDVCHLAVAFEDPLQAVQRILDAGISLHKIQLSAALKVSHPGAQQKRELRAFAEDVYLHQTAASGTQGITRWPDLPDALADDREYDEWRIHFHVPLWAERIGNFSTTRDVVSAILQLHKNSPLSPHLEVETYTWDVLGAGHKQFDLTTSIVQELRWVREQLA
jgi:sugar phosphate isomerase/epimerase